MVRPGWVTSGTNVSSGVVEAEPALVAQRHHQHRGERLGVGRDQELVVGVRRRVRVVEVGGADALLPDQAAAADHAGEDAGHAAGALAVEDGAVQLGGWCRRGGRSRARP